MSLQVKLKEVPEVVAGGEAGTVCWVCGEASTVEVEIRNPTIIPIKVWAHPRHLPSPSGVRYCKLTT